MTVAIVHQNHSIEASAFEDRWRRSASALRAAGIREGDVVALMMRNHPLAVELALAVRWAGAQWCPVNWHYKTDEVQYILGNSGAKALVIDGDLLQGLPGLNTAGVQVWVSDAPARSAPNESSWTDWRDRHDAWSGAGPAQRGAMFYTSGTTGRPKGIQRHAATPEQAVRMTTVRRQCYGFRVGMRALLSAPIYHSAPNGYAVGAVLDQGTLFLEPRFDAEQTLQLIERERLTHAYLVPTMFVRLLALPADVRSRYDLSSLEFIASTGSPCPPAVKRAMIEWWGPVIFESYGASELGYMTLLHPDEALRKPGSAGRPLDGVTLDIRDEAGQRQPRGTPGLIYIDQPAFADFSYVGNDSARRAMELDGLKTMGDVGYLDDEGFLFIVDRAADMVISGGVNVYPAEIEHVLLAMPGVADCAVFGIPDDEFGEALHAAVQPSEGHAIDAQAVRAHLAERLAGFKVPRQVSFHASLPREDTGKIFKRKLREPFWQGRARRV